jgi:hypothetical protein
LEEFFALRERLLFEQDLAEYCAALTASAIYNVNRKATTPPMSPEAVMWLRKSRTSGPIPSTTPMRFARPGERPPSARPPGAPDDIFERMDKLADRMKQQRIN